MFLSSQHLLSAVGTLNVCCPEYRPLEPLGSCSGGTLATSISSFHQLSQLEVWVSMHCPLLTPVATLSQALRKTGRMEHGSKGMVARILGSGHFRSFLLGEGRKLYAGPGEMGPHPSMSSSSVSLALWGVLMLSPFPTTATSHFT